MVTTWNQIPAPAGPNQVPNPTFATNGVGWTTLQGSWDFSSGAKPTVGSQAQLSSTAFTLNQDTLYTAVIVITGWTIGAIDWFAGNGGASLSGNGTFTQDFLEFDPTGPQNFQFAADADFDGTIVSVSLGVMKGTSWTTIPAPTGTTSVMTGYAYGLLMAITRPQAITSDNWTRIGAPATVWTPIPKAL